MVVSTSQLCWGRSRGQEEAAHHPHSVLASHPHSFQKYTGVFTITVCVVLSPSVFRAIIITLWAVTMKVHTNSRLGINANTSKRRASIIVVAHPVFASVGALAHAAPVADGVSDVNVVVRVRGRYPSNCTGDRGALRGLHVRQIILVVAARALSERRGRGVDVQREARVRLNQCLAIGPFGTEVAGSVGTVACALSIPGGSGTGPIGRTYCNRSANRGKRARPNYRKPGRREGHR